MSSNVQLSTTPVGQFLSVAAVLSERKTSLIADWLQRAKQNAELTHLHLTDEERTGHLPKLVDDLITRLGKARTPTRDNDAAKSNPAIVHGKLRFKQGYTVPMLVDESRILQVTIFGTLHDNQAALDLRVVLADVVIIADEVDSQLTQTVKGFMEMRDRSPVA